MYDQKCTILQDHQKITFFKITAIPMGQTLCTHTYFPSHNLFVCEDFVHKIYPHIMMDKGYLHSSRSCLKSFSFNISSWHLLQKGSHHVEGHVKLSWRIISLFVYHLVWGHLGSWKKCAYLCLLANSEKLTRRFGIIYKIIIRKQ